MKTLFCFSKKSNTYPEDEERNSFQILALLSASLASCTAGILFCWPSPSIPILISKEFPGDITLEDASYLSVIPPIASILTNPLYSLSMNKIGRKYTLLSVAIPHLLAWIIIANTDSIYLLYVTRVLSGMADGCLFSAMPTYIGEICTPKVRGSWGTLAITLAYAGQVLINIVGGYLDIRTTAYVMMFIPLVFLVTFSIMPESPYYLLMKGRHEDAKRSLQMLRRKHDVDLELKQLIHDIQRQTSESGSLKDLFLDKVNRRALIAGIFVRFAQIVCGMAAISVYTQYFFNQAGGSFSATESSIILTSALCITIAIASFFLDVLGRRKTMLISCCGCAFFLASESLYFYLKDFTSIDTSTLNWYPVAGMIFFVIFFSIGLAIVPPIILGELFSANIKAKGMVVVNILFNICIGVVTILFPIFTTNFGLFSPFLFYCVCTIFAAIVAYFVVPETKGKTLEEIQQGFMRDVNK